MTIRKLLLRIRVYSLLVLLLYWKESIASFFIPSYHSFRQRKRSTILAVAKAHNTTTLVETGTYLGETIYGLRNNFRKIITIELDTDLWNNAKSRFRNNTNITIIQGDSAEQLKAVLATLHKPAIFWLDAHYSGGLTAKGKTFTLIEEEVRLILKQPIRGHCILIDDASYFTGKKDYPTLEKMKKIVSATHPEKSFAVANDIIIITPKIVVL